MTGALAALGHPAIVTSDPADVRRAERVIVPGQGHFGACMQGLASRGLDAALRDVVARETPYFGICLGLQVLFDESDESPGVRGLGLLRGRVARLSGGASVKIPHMGWNALEGVRREGPLASTAEGEHVYFVHSYHAVCADPADAWARSTHGETFCAAVGRGRVWATQFHPEKSGRAGLAILDAFAKVPV